MSFFGIAPGNLEFYDAVQQADKQIKRREGKPKWIWLPAHQHRDQFPFQVLDADLIISKQLVHKMLTMG